MTQCHDTYETDRLAAAHTPLLVRDVMTTTPFTVEPAATVKEIAQVLLHHDVRALPVIDIGDVLVGVVSEADIICRECPTARRHTLGGLVDRVLGHDHGWAAKADGITAGEIMTKEVVCTHSTDPISVAARRMLSEAVRMMPVVDDGHLVGVLSRHDIVSIFDRPDSEVRDRITKLLASPLWAPDGHHIRAEVADGMVHLCGTVRYPSDAHVVASVISGLPGVIEVRDELTAELPEPKPSYLKDSDWR